MRSFVFTCGDVNGIGPEIDLKAINLIFNPKKYKLIVPIPLSVLDYYKSKIKFKFPYETINSFKPKNKDNGLVSFINIGKGSLHFGSPTKSSGNISIRSINRAYSLIKSGLADAMITAPISKISWKLNGVKHPGHTEYLADLTGSNNYAMMFLSNKFKCALATIHKPIGEVPRLITKCSLLKLFELISKTLIDDFNFKDPKLAVLGLNPHAGEDGHIGKEELKIISPVINKSFSEKGIFVEGPFVPDAFFAKKLFSEYAAVIGMYHDQLLIPFKMLNFKKGVNFTAGLPIVRTSPDHGTAYDIAGKNIADPTSIIEAFRWADKIVNNRINFKT